MATKEQIRKAILDLSGNPDTGIVAENVDAWAQAIVDLDKPVKETRVVEAQETR